MTRSRPRADDRSRSRVEPLTPGISSGARTRGHLAAAVISLGLVGLTYRAWALQVDDNLHYRELAERQHGLVVELPAPRGEIRDAMGRALAVSADADSVWANPQQIRDVAATAEKLAAILGVDPAPLEAKLAADRRFVWIARHVAPEVAAGVRAARLAGIELAREPHRWYPARSIGGPIVGRSDIDGNGLDGIELAMNTTLTGTRGAGRAVRDARGRRTFADGLEPPEPGSSVQLTIDRSIQAIADDAIAETVQSHAAHSGVVVVLDVATSHVLAMASFPTSDPNIPGHAARNRTITDAYEAGSIMKLFSIAGALDAGAVTPDTEIETQNGLMYIGRDAIRDVHDDKYLTVAGVFKRSSNVGAVKIAQRLGKDRLHAALVRFGFGARTGIELPGEVGGVLRPAKRWRDIEHATIAYGYGLTVTPLQVAAALASIGNDGIYRAPRVIAATIDPAGHVTTAAAAEPRRVISERSARQMRAMLASVFESGKNPGTAHDLVVPGFVCGGKTGTAHKYDPAARKYAPDHYLSSFAGIAPIDNPRLAIVVIVDDPSEGDYFGGKVAGPVFARVASESLRYLGVRGETLQCPPLPRGRIDPLAVFPAKTCVIPAPPAQQPPRPARPPTPPSPLRSDAASAAPIEPAAEDTGVPDFRGMGMRRALDTARAAGIAVEIRGNGRVVEQTRDQTRVVLTFSDGDLPSPATP